MRKTRPLGQVLEGWEQFTTFPANANPSAKRHLLQTPPFPIAMFSNRHLPPTATFSNRHLRQPPGDVVAIELLPEDQWKGASAKLPGAKPSNNNAAGAGDEEEEQEEGGEQLGAEVFQVWGRCGGRGMGSGTGRGQPRGGGAAGE